MNVSFLMPSRTVVDPRVLQSALALTVDAARHEIFLQPEVEYERLSVQFSRENLAEVFLASGNEWSFWMDADMLVPAGAVSAMLEQANVEPFSGESLSASAPRIVTGIYYDRGKFDLATKATKALVKGKYAEAQVDAFMAGKSYRPLLHLGAGQQWSDTEPFEVEAAGMGCMLIHRNVFQSMTRPYFDYDGEDFGFCGAAKKAGFKIIALPSVQCGHIGTPPVITAADFKEQKRG